MRIVVCVKQVPDTNEVRIDQATGTLIREGVPSIINPDDKNALEAALQLKDQNENVEVVVLCMGPAQAKEAIKEALAMGADRAVLLSDRAFAGSDTWATSTILAAAVAKIGDFDVVLCGRQAIDGDTAQVGPQIAEHLDLPQVTYVQNIAKNGDKLRVERALEDGHYVLDVEMPVVLTAIKELNEPRYPSVSGIYNYFDDSERPEILMWNVNDIDFDMTQIGLKGSPTKVNKSFVPTQKFEGERLEGSAKEAVRKLIVRLHERQLV
jgi:electron transfer flavoprotein beta subunit